MNEASHVGRGAPAPEVKGARFLLAQPSIEGCLFRLPCKVSQGSWFQYVSHKCLLCARQYWRGERSPDSATPSPCAPPGPRHLSCLGAIRATWLY